jgi:hypothetical protein
VVFLLYKTTFLMKSNLFLFALPCFIFMACGGSANKEAEKKMNDSIAAAHRFDSLQNAIKSMHAQDSIAAGKASDSAKKADSAKGQK